MQQSQKPHLAQQQQEISEIFNEFKNLETGTLNVNEFIDVLQMTGLERNCELLIKKLELLGNQSIDEEQFGSLFNFNYQDKDNFNLIFGMLDVSRSGKISKDELKKQNDIWGIHLKEIGLQLSERDIDIMISYSGSKEQDVITKDVLWNLIRNQQTQQKAL